ncbi:MAG: hemin uptake protein HemP [Planctomycetaceae bacterium]
MSWFSRNLGRSRRPEPRVVESGQILREDQEIVIQHGYHKYRLRATRNGRLRMSGNRFAVEVRWIALAFGLILGYLAGLPVVAAISTFAPSSEPILQVLYAPAILVYETCSPYEWYCDWLLDFIVKRL